MKQSFKRILVLAVLALFLTSATLTSPAFATEVEEGSEPPAAPPAATSAYDLTILPAGDADMAADLTAYNLVVDLYKVADYERDSTGQRFVPCTGFEALADDLEQIWNKDLKATEDLRAKADGIIFGKLLEILADPNHKVEDITAEKAKMIQPAYADVAVNDLYSDQGRADALTAGLYILVPHDDRPIEEYMKRSTVKVNTGETDEDGTPKTEELQVINSTALTKEYEYTFTPQMITLPYYNEADATWTNSPTVTLKPSRQQLPVKLIIVKSLRELEIHEQVMFVFRVEGTKADGKPLSNVYTISFEKGDNVLLKAIEVDNLKPGSSVTVTEEYSGMAYEIVTEDSPEKTITIDAGEVGLVRFENEYTNRKGGHGVLNHIYDKGNDLYEGYDNDENSYPFPGEQKNLPQ